MWRNNKVHTAEEFISNKWMDNLYANSKAKGGGNRPSPGLSESTSQFANPD